VLILSLLEFQNVSFINDGETILKNISLTIEKGDFISVIGPSGSGKSTLLKLSSHLISPTKGNIIFKGKNVTEYNPTELRKKIAYCFQSPYLFGSTVLDNLIFPFSIRNIKPDEKRIKELFSLFQMTTDFLQKDVKNLSGGEKQRISLLRSIIFLPEILLLDEVTSALDVDNSILVENIISSLNKEGLTVLWVTHNPLKMRKYANKIITIEMGEIKSLEVI